MNRLCRELSEICRDAPLKEKWILAPSLRVGHQWLDRITLAGAPVVNARVKTLKSMALDLAGPEMVSQGLSLVSTTGSLIIINAIAAEMTKEPSRYLSSLTVTPGLARTILSTVTAMRQAGLGPEALHAKHFEAPEKAMDLTYVLTRYVQELQERHLIDFADVLRMAIELMNSRATPLEDVLVIVPEDLDLTAVERGFLDCLPGSAVRTVAVDSLRVPPKSAHRSLLTRNSSDGSSSRRSPRRHWPTARPKSSTRAEKPTKPVRCCGDACPPAIDWMRWKCSTRMPKPTCRSSSRRSCAWNPILNSTAHRCP